MRVSVMRSGSDKIVYIVESFRVGKKVVTKVVERVGKLSDLALEHDDPIAFAKERAKELTEERKLCEENFDVRFFTQRDLPDGCQTSFNAGYLFLQKIYYGLSLDKVCSRIQQKTKCEYDLNGIVKDLVFSRILYPSSKRSSFELSHRFIEQPDYELHDVYRSLGLLCDHMPLVQSEAYKNSSQVCERNTDVLYYDCTNFFFETEGEDALRRYGVSKEHRPNPIVQLGLFMDGNGIPLAFNVNPGSQSEQLSPIPTEKMIERDFGLSKFVYCSDAGLGSYHIRWFNQLRDRSFIVAQSLKKLKGHLRDWALGDGNWKGGASIGSLPPDSAEMLIKSRPILEKGTVRLEKPSELGDGAAEILNVQKEIDQRLIVTYSPQYAAYQKSIRDGQVERARKLIRHPASFDRCSSTDCRRFVKNIAFTKDGEIVGKNLCLDESLISEEGQYDGFYALITNLDGSDEEIVKINHGRWRIEESFRIMKTEFKSRPVYVQKEGHIKAHFLTCYLALLVYRILEQKLNSGDRHFTTREIVDALRNMNLFKLGEIGFASNYPNSQLLEALCKEFDLPLNKQAYRIDKIKKMIKQTKR